MAEQHKPKDEPQARPRRFFRKTSNKMIGGVCAGISEHFDVDVNLIRIAWVAAVLLGGISIVLYILAWIIIPEDKAQGAISQPPATARSNTNVVWGAILIVFGLLFLNHGWTHRFSRFDLPDFGWAFGFDSRVLVALALIAGGAYYLFEVRKNKQESTTGTSNGDKPMEKRLTRSKSERMVAGVCGGLAEYFNVDPSFIRIGFALGTLVTHFLGVIAYIVMAVVVPESPGSAVQSKTAEKS